MRLLVTRAGRINQLTYAASGQSLISCEGDRTGTYRLRRWDLRTGKAVETNSLVDRPRHVALSAAGEVLAYATGDTVVVEDSTDQPEQSLELVNIGHPPADALALSADGASLAFARRRSGTELLLGSETVVVSVQPSPGPPRSRTLGAGEVLRLLAFSRDGRLLASAGSSQLTLWDLLRGESEAVWSLENTSQMVFSPDSTTLAVAANGLIYLWNFKPRPKWRAEPPGKRDPIFAMCFSPDGRNLVTGQGADVRFWEISDAAQVAQWDWNIGLITAVAIAPDGLTAAAGSEEGKIVIWDIGE
jgi:WD40 repeat protein